jgi:hypothetical protein
MANLVKGSVSTKGCGLGLGGQWSATTQVTYYVHMYQLVCPCPSSSTRREELRKGAKLK